jgi:predicted Zn-dependent protease
MSVPPRSARFAALVAQQPENELFRFSLAQALDTEGQFEEAAIHYGFCVARKADWMMPRILLGKLLLRMGRTGDARPVLEEALALAVAQHHEEPEAELRGLLAIR